jgi:hypothetical protein
MAGFLFKLETVEGTPAEPSTLSSAVPNWCPGETIHFGNKAVARGREADSLVSFGACGEG